MQLFTDDLYVRTQFVQLHPRLFHHRLTKAVVLADEEHSLQGTVFAQHRHQGRQAHVGMRIEAKMPEAATLIGERRLYRRVIEKEGASLGFAFVVFAQGIHQGQCNRGTVALQHKARAPIKRHLQGRQRLFQTALVVDALQGQGPRPAGQTNTPALVHALDGPHQIAVHRFTGVGKRPTQTFHKSQRDGRRISHRRR